MPSLSNVLDVFVCELAQSVSSGVAGAGELAIVVDCQSQSTHYHLRLLRGAYVSAHGSHQLVERRSGLGTASSVQAPLSLGRPLVSVRHACESEALPSRQLAGLKQRGGIAMPRPVCGLIDWCERGCA